MRRTLSAWLARRGPSTEHVDSGSEHSQLAPARRPRHVEGRVLGVERRQVSESVPALVAVIEDDAGERTTMIWLGRTSIGGIDVGARLRAAGLATTVKTLPAIYNPTYDLLPRSEPPRSAAGGTS